jgi:5-methylcytosine-specific restriction endonuclease McrA
MKEKTPELLAELAKVGWFKELHLSVLVCADFRCEYCGQDLLASFNECFNAQLDHIHPKSKGGSDEKSNLAVCCTTCNSLKWNYVPCGDNRDDRLADAGRYVREQRKVQEEMGSRYRELVRR